MKKNNVTDVCVIGSGAGGAVTAKELGESGLNVVVLEAGRRFNPIKDYQIVTSNDWERLNNEHSAKFKVKALDTVTVESPGMGRPAEAFGVGGGTLRYHANKIRMLPNDFKMETVDGVGFDWPISYSDLAPYYRSVEWELGVSGKGGDPWFPDIEGYPNPPFSYSYLSQVLEPSFKKVGLRLWPNPVGRPSMPFDGRPACIQCGRCSSGCLIRAKCSSDITYIAKAESTGNVEVRVESIVTRIKVNSEGKVKSVLYYDKNDIEQELEAKVVVLSTGSIQSPRLLLNSKSSRFPDGLANSSGLIGKYYMVHLTLETSARLDGKVDSFRGHSGAISLDTVESSKSNDYVRGFSIKPRSNLEGPATMAINTRGWGSWHKKHMMSNFGHLISFRALGEKLPDKDNRVELDSEKVDKYGMPVPKILIKFNRNDERILEAIEKKSKEIFYAAKATDIKIERIKTRSPAHNMGTCRMGNNPDNSVLNSFCQTHDINNLFVIDASCFVSCGTSNPSLTIQAIAKRSSEYIIEEIKKGKI